VTIDLALGTILGRRKLGFLSLGSARSLFILALVSPLLVRCSTGIASNLGESA